MELQLSWCNVTASNNGRLCADDAADIPLDWGLCSNKSLSRPTPPAWWKTSSRRKTSLFWTILHLHLRWILLRTWERVTKKVPILTPWSNIPTSLLPTLSSHPAWLNHFWSGDTSVTKSFNALELYLILLSVFLKCAMKCAIQINLPCLPKVTLNPFNSPRVQNHVLYYMKLVLTILLNKTIQKKQGK